MKGKEVKRKKISDLFLKFNEKHGLNLVGLYIPFGELVWAEARLDAGKDIIQDIGTFTHYYKQKKKCNCEVCKFIRLYQKELSGYIKKKEKELRI